MKSFVCTKNKPQQPKNQKTNKSAKSKKKQNQIYRGKTSKKPKKKQNQKKTLTTNHSQIQLLCVKLLINRMANEINKIYICILYIKYSCINHNNFLYLKCNFCTQTKNQNQTKKNNNFYPKWKARKTLTGKQICCCCVLQIKKNKNVVSGKFLYANTTSGYRTTPPRHSTPTVHRPHTEHLAHPFQR